MAGRILPIALATVAGVSIGVATFDSEFKEQRRQRLEEKYKRDVAAVASLNSEGPSPMASSAIKPPAPEQFPVNTETKKPSKLASLMGAWAWKKQEGTPVVAKDEMSMNKISEKPKQGREN